MLTRPSRILRLLRVRRVGRRWRKSRRRWARPVWNRLRWGGWRWDRRGWRLGGGRSKEPGYAGRTAEGGCPHIFLADAWATATGRFADQILFIRSRKAWWMRGSSESSG